MVVTFIIIFNLTIFGIGFYLINKKFSKLINKKNSNVKKLKSKFYKKPILKNNLGIYSSGEKDVKIENSNGDLVPYGMSNHEKELLNMFYND